MGKVRFRRKKGVTARREEAPAYGAWYLDYTDAAGKRQQPKCPARTRTEAQQHLLEVEAQVWRQRQGLELGAARPITFGDAAKEYRETIRHLVSYRQADIQLRVYLEPAFGKLLLTDISPADVDAFISRLRTTGGPAGAGLAPGTLRLLQIRLSAVYTWAKRKRLFKGDPPTREASRVKVPKRMPRSLTPEQLEKLMDAAGQWWLLYLTDIYAGPRKGELLALRWEDIDFEKNLLHVARSYDRDTTKGGNDRTIPLHPHLRAALLKARETSTSPFVFPNPKGGMRTRNFDASTPFKRALVRAGLVRAWRVSCACGYAAELPARRAVQCPTCSTALLPAAMPLELTFRHLRSTFASMLGDLRVAQEALGHSEPSTTAKHYVGVNMEQLRRRVEALPDLDAPASPVRRPT